MTNSTNQPQHIQSQSPVHPQFNQFQQPTGLPQYSYNNSAPIHPSSLPQLSPRNSHSELRCRPTNHISSNYLTSSSSTQRSPSISARSSFSNTQTPLITKRHSFSESANTSPSSSLNNEQIIDLMEREQDGIVLKLMREIDNLKQENKSLKNNGGSVNQSSSNGSNSNMVRRSSSLSSHRNSISSYTLAPGPGPQPIGNLGSSNLNAASNKRNSTFSANYSVASATSSDDMYKKFKSASIDPKTSVPRETSPNAKPGSRSRNNSMNSYDLVWEENKYLRHELSKLRQEVDALKKEQR